MIKFWIRYGLDFAGIRWVFDLFGLLARKLI